MGQFSEVLVNDTIFGVEYRYRRREGGITMSEESRPEPGKLVSQLMQQMRQEADQRGISVEEYFDSLVTAEGIAEVLDRMGGR
jgi:hypothetical protein